MSKSRRLMPALICLPVAFSAQAQAPNQSNLDAQAKAMAALSFLDGEWAGPAVAMERTGPIKMTQTERSGNLLGGTVRLVEGRSFDRAGKTIFNAFAVISYDIPRARYSITSYASGYATTTELKLIKDGFEWEVPAGPSAKMHFTAVVKRGVWSEVGDFVGNDGKPRRTFEMTVRRLRTTGWPQGQMVKYK